MLKHDDELSYFVYPSWAKLAYRWDELPRAMARPLEYGRFQPGFDPQAFGYPAEPQAYRLERGPRGGGIVIVNARKGERWLAARVLGLDANIRSPDAVLSMQGDSFASRVLYVEPYESASPFAGVPVQRLHVCGASPEHLDSAGGAVYWVLGHSRGRAELPEQQEVVEVGREFGLGVSLVGATPISVKAEAEPMFANQAIHYVWYEVVGKTDSAGHHFAWLLYTALHMKALIGQHMRVMHLCAAIEGRPRAREFWAKRLPNWRVVR